MLRQIYLLCALAGISACHSQAQSSKAAYYFGDPIVADSSSTMIIPTRYTQDFLSANKIALWNDVYANVVFYNFLTDSSKKLFSEDTYIMGFGPRYNPYGREPEKNMTSKWILYRVKNIDRNRNGRIDDRDPALLYISDVYGKNLKALTTENENIVGINLFEKQNFALLKVQRDETGDMDYEYNDKDFYYIKLDLNTLKFGNKIEINTGLEEEIETSTRSK